MLVVKADSSVEKVITLLVCIMFGCLIHTSDHSNIHVAYSSVSYSIQYCNALPKQVLQWCSGAVPCMYSHTSEASRNAALFHSAFFKTVVRIPLRMLGSIVPRSGIWDPFWGDQTHQIRGIGLTEFGNFLRRLLIFMSIQRRLGRSTRSLRWNVDSFSTLFK